MAKARSRRRAGNNSMTPYGRVGTAGFTLIVCFAVLHCWHQGEVCLVSTNQPPSVSGGTARGKSFWEKSRVWEENRLAIIEAGKFVPTLIGGGLTRVGAYLPRTSLCWSLLAGGLACSGAVWYSIIWQDKKNKTSIFADSIEYSYLVLKIIKP